MSQEHVKVSSVARVLSKQLSDVVSHLENTQAILASAGIEFVPYDDCLDDLSLHGINLYCERLRLLASGASFKRREGVRRPRRKLEHANG